MLFLSLVQPAEAKPPAVEFAKCVRGILKDSQPTIKQRHIKVEVSTAPVPKGSGELQTKLVRLGVDKEHLDLVMSACALVLKIAYQPESAGLLIGHCYLDPEQCLHFYNRHRPEHLHVKCKAVTQCGQRHYLVSTNQYRWIKPEAGIRTICEAGKLDGSALQSIDGYEVTPAGTVYCAVFP